MSISDGKTEKNTWLGKRSVERALLSKPLTPRAQYAHAASIDEILKRHAK